MLYKTKWKTDILYGVIPQATRILLTPLKLGSTTRGKTETGRVWECKEREELSPFPEYKLKASCNHIAGMQSVYTVKHSLSPGSTLLSQHCAQRSLCSVCSWKAMASHSLLLPLAALSLLCCFCHSPLFLLSFALFFSFTASFWPLELSLFLSFCSSSWAWILAAELLNRQRVHKQGQQAYVTPKKMHKMYHDND